MDGSRLVHRQHRKPGKPQLHVEADGKVYKVSMTGLAKVLFVGKKKRPWNTDPYGEAKDRRKGTMQARGFLGEKSERHFKRCIYIIGRFFRFKVPRNIQSRISAWKSGRTEVLWWKTQSGLRAHCQPVQPKAIQKNRTLACIARCWSPSTGSHKHSKEKLWNLSITTYKLCTRPHSGQ